MKMRDLINLVENTGQSAEPLGMPDIQIKRVSPTMRQIFINSEKAGTLHFGTHDRHVGMGTWRKERSWTGEFVFDGTTIQVGRTDKIKDLLPKVTKLVRSYLIRKRAETTP